MISQEVLQQVYDLQKELAVNQQKIKIYDTHISSLNKTKQKCNITIKELENLQDNNKVFRLLGKAFFLSDPKELGQELEGSIKDYDKELDECTKYKKHFEEKYKDLDKQMQEAITVARQQA
eukprot:TRINITY_DN1035_c0_g1_i2.p2 TRINITY_DN1035_c0_g1~~TRINITY_DN1035_c0_g1_i2.p2  ORF type:complete len:121 (+),score=19.09 TRINITY_DN1035_c0_g1_i2:62-424(+)